jgi:UDP-3-O-[3-hydroxymyristoyl] glucosamine N-acyltransferase
MKDRNYKILEDEFITINDIKLYRIECIKSFINNNTTINVGDKGGYIQSYDNLYDNAWVYDKARVCENAKAFGNAKIYGDTKVFGNACIYDNAEVFENVWVHGKASVYDNARVFNNAKIYGNSLIYGNSYVSHNAWVFGNARVYDSSTISDNVKVYNNAKVYGNARVYGNVCVYDYAQVYENARIWGNTQVYGNTSISDNTIISDNAEGSDNAINNNITPINNKQVNLTPIETIDRQSEISIYQNSITNKISIGFLNSRSTKDKHIDLYLTIPQESKKIEENDWCILYDDIGTTMSNPQQYNPKIGHKINKNLQKVIATTNPNIKEIPKINLELIKIFVNQKNNGNNSKIKSSLIFIKGELKVDENNYVIINNKNYNYNDIIKAILYTYKKTKEGLTHNQILINYEIDKHH